MKRGFDLTVLIVAHIVLFPLWVLIWTVVPLMIWLTDRGPVFYRQPRVGREGRVFYALKFRTMVSDADKAGQVLAAYADPRITRIGRFLRRTALDELPQILSIWKGDMSFVGPRPEQPDIHDRISEELPEFQLRLAVRPGLTGLAQVREQYSPPPRVKLEYDLEYIETISLWLDIRLMLHSVWNTIFARWDDRPSQ